MDFNPNSNANVDVNFEDWLNLPLIEDDPNHVHDDLSSAQTFEPTYSNFPTTGTYPDETFELMANGLPAYPDLAAGPEGMFDLLDPSNGQFYLPLQPLKISNLEPIVPAPLTPVPLVPAPQLFLTPESRWQAVIDRTPNAPFVYAVLSTKIYCRATCPSRRPLRNNVRFHDTASEAAAAGFRPCKRCKPDDVAGEAAEQRQAAAVERAKALIENASRNGEKIPLDQLASEAGLSTFYFHRVFRKRVGVTPEEWGKRCRQRISRA
ncbi:hypothetical protein FRC07_010954 [Ceratobasidium sp. 392]|nr:hypothetical protein FRC07_010954 [Ceratobasidium sp. 392]